MVKVSQFKLLVVAEKKNFVYKLFLTLDITDLSFFYVKNTTPLKKVTPFFSQPPLKIEILPIPLLENLVEGSAVLPRKEWFGMTLVKKGRQK